MSDGGMSDSVSTCSSSSFGSEVQCSVYLGMPDQSPILQIHSDLVGQIAIKKYELYALLREYSLENPDADLSRFGCELSFFVED